MYAARRVSRVADRDVASNYRSRLSVISRAAKLSSSSLSCSISRSLPNQRCQEPRSYVSAVYFVSTRRPPLLLRSRLELVLPHCNDGERLFNKVSRCSRNGDISRAF